MVPTIAWAQTDSSSTTSSDVARIEGGASYATLQEAFDAAQAGDEIVLLNDVEANVTVPVTASPVVLDLNGKTIAGAKSDEKYEKDTLTIQGSLTVKDSTVSQPPVVSDDFKTVTYSAGKILGKSPTKTPWPKAVVVQDGGSLILESGIIESEDSDAVFVKNNSMFTVKGGYIHSAEFGIGVQGEGATLNFEEGVVVADNNAAIGGNGQEQYADTTITVSGGQVISHISASGYIACGIYHPQRGSLTISGGTIYADNGVGVLLRGGKLSMTGGTVMGSGSQSGKVGDSGVSINSNGIAIHDHEDYYDHNGIKVTISAGTIKADAPALATPKNDLISLTGGTYSSDPTAFVAEGYYAELANAMYTVKQKEKASIVFDTNGGSSVSSSPLEGYAPDPISPRDMPTTTRDGYDFIGWTDWQGNPVDMLPEKFTAGTTTYFAQWEKKITPPSAPDTTIHVQVSQVSDDASAPKPVVTDKAVQAAAASAGTALESIKQGITPEGIAPEKAAEVQQALQSAPADSKVSVTVAVKAEQRAEDNVPSDDKSAIGNVATSDEETVYFELSVLMTVKIENAQGGLIKSVDDIELTAVDEPLLIEIHVDPDLIKNKAVRIAHVHNGVTEIIQPESINRETGVIRVYASAFSTYALLTSSTVTVTFETNGGSAVAPQSVPFGSVATRPADPTRSSYVFAGWYSDQKLTRAFDFATPLDSSITLYAKWTSAGSGNETLPSTTQTGELAKTGDPAGTFVTGIGALAIGALVVVAAAGLYRRRHS